MGTKHSKHRGAPAAKKLESLPEITVAFELSDSSVDDTAADVEQLKRVRDNVAECRAKIAQLTVGELGVAAEGLRKDLNEARLIVEDRLDSLLAERRELIGQISASFSLLEKRLNKS